MTGQQWKDMVLQAVTTVSVSPYLMELLDNPLQDTREAVSVLLEVLPSLSPAKISMALHQYQTETGIPVRDEFQKLAEKREKANSEEALEQMDAQILEAAMEFLNQSELLDLNPSYHYLT